MHDTCSDEKDRLRLVCRKSDTVTEPAATAALDAELSLSASMQLPGDMLMLPAARTPTTSLGDMYDMRWLRVVVVDARAGCSTADNRLVRRARHPRRVRSSIIR